MTYPPTTSSRRRVTPIWREPLRLGAKGHLEEPFNDFGSGKHARETRILDSDEGAEHSISELALCLTLKLPEEASATRIERAVDVFLDAYSKGGRRNRYR